MEKKGRFDAWGNPILDFIGMQKYYAGCDRSSKILRQLMPHRYFVIPDVEIRVFKNRPGEIEVIRLYPGGSNRNVYIIKDRAMDALRRLWKGTGRAWKKQDMGYYVAFRKNGCVCRETAGKFGALA